MVWLRVPSWQWLTKRHRVAKKKGGNHHRIIIESLELAETFKGHLVHLPCNERGDAQLDHVAQGLIQTHLLQSPVLEELTEQGTANKPGAMQEQFSPLYS